MLNITYKYQRETDPLTVASLDDIFSEFSSNINHLTLLSVQDFTFGKFHVSSVLLGEHYNWHTALTDSDIWAPINQSAGLTSEADLDGLFDIANNFVSSTDDTLLVPGSSGNGWVKLVILGTKVTQIEGYAINLGNYSYNSVTGILVKYDVYYLNNAYAARELVVALQIKLDDTTWITVPRSVRRTALAAAHAGYYESGSVEASMLIASDDVPLIGGYRTIKGVRIVVAKSGGTENQDTITISDAYLTAIPLVGAFP